MAKAATAASERTVLEVVENLQALLWGRIEEGVRKLVKTLVEQSLEADAKEVAGAERHERTPQRRHYRGGHYRRRLLTKHGAVEVQVPRLARQRLRFCAFDRYERRRWRKHAKKRPGPAGRRNVTATWQTRDRRTGHLSTNGP